MYLACQHHVNKVVLKGIFQKIVAPWSGPDITLFVRFKEAWESIDKSLYTPGVADPDVVRGLQGKANEIKEYALKQLEVSPY